MIGPSIPTCLALTGVGAAAGLLNTLAGGGGLLVMPILLCVGLSPAQAIATNKLQSLLGLVTALAHFTRARLVDPSFAVRVVPSALGGAVAGALLVQRVPPDLLARVVPLLLMAAAAYLLVSPMRDRVDRRRLPVATYAATIGLALGAYDGFFGPGVGSLWMVSLMGLAGQRLGKATAHANLLNVAGSAGAFAVLAAGGQVVPWVGLCLGAGQILGSWLGARLVIERSIRWVKPLMVVTTLGAATKLMFG